MATERKTIAKIAETKLRIVDEEVYRALSLLLDHESLRKAIQLRLTESIVAFEKLGETIPYEDFRRFMRTPQISDLTKLYLTYCLMMNIVRRKDRRSILKEDVYTYLIKAIETDFPSLSNEETIGAIRSFFDCLIDICTREFEFEIFSDYLKDNGSLKPELFHIIQDRYLSSGEKPLDKLGRKMTAIMNTAVIPRNIAYEQEMKEYNKSIQQLNQNGFIYLLGEHKFQEFYIPPKLVPARSGNYHTYQRQLILAKNAMLYYSIQDHWRNIFIQEDIIYVIGGAGYGKSLFLKNVLNNAARLNIENADEYLLILCDLKSFVSEGESKKTIPDYFQESMVKATGLEGITKDFILYYLRIGRCIVLLDALDEVPKRGRKDLHKKILTFFRNYNPSNKICITSRNRGFIPEENIEAFEIAPLTSDDIEAYIDKMILLKKFKREDKKRFMEQAQALIQKGFLNNFLILSLLVNIYKAERELPENKIDLYKKCFEYIAKKREEEKSKTGYNWNAIYPLMKDSTFISLAVLAAPNNHDISKSEIEDKLLAQYKKKYVDEATAECAIRDFLDFCSNRTELFVPAAVDDKFKFFHRSFFEYFYSRYIYQQSDVQTMYNLMADFDIDSEVFELTVAMIKEDNEEKYQSLIQYIIDEVNREFSSSANYNLNCTAFGILTLAMQVVDDAYFIKCYYEIIIKYKRFMTNKKIAGMNQRLICMWIEKNCMTTEEKYRFVETYRRLYAQYVLSVLSGIETSKNDELLFLNSRNPLLSDAEKNLGIRYAFEEKHLPFYVILCGRYGDLHGLMDDCVSKGFESIVSTGVDRKEKNAMKKGFNRYLKMSDKTKDDFFSSMIRSGGNEFLLMDSKPLEEE